MKINRNSKTPTVLCSDDSRENARGTVSLLPFILFNGAVVELFTLFSSYLQQHYIIQSNRLT